MEAAAQERLVAAVIVVAAATAAVEPAVVFAVAVAVAGVAVTAQVVAAGSAASGTQLGMEHKAAHYLFVAAHTEGLQDWDSPGSKKMWRLRLERQVTGWTSIAEGFALVVAKADLGEDCFGSLVVADRPHHSVEWGLARSLGSWERAVNRHFVVEPGWSIAYWDHNQYCRTEEAYHRSCEVIEAVGMCYTQLGDNCKLPVLQQGLQYRSSPLHLGRWEYFGLLRGIYSMRIVADECYSSQSSVGHKYEKAAPLAYDHSSEQRSPILNEDQEECL